MRRLLFRTIHLKQIGELVKLRGGLEQMSSQSGLRDVLIQIGELSAGHLEASHPGCEISKPSIYQEQPMTMYDTLQALPLGFRRMATEGAMCDSTVNKIVKMSKSIHDESHESRRISEGSSVSDGVQPLFFPNSIGLLEKLLRLALLRHQVNSCTRIQHSICPHEDVALTLTRKLPEVVPPSGQAERNVLLCIWLVTIDAWSIGTKLGRLAPRGMELLLQLPFKFPETARWNLTDFEAFGRQFFWRESARRWLQPSLELVRNQSPFPKTIFAQRDLADSIWDLRLLSIRAQGWGSSKISGRLDTPPLVVSSHGLLPDRIM